MLLRIDRWGTELPPPSDPDPAGVLRSGRQHRRRGVRHIELVAATFNTMLTGASPASNGKAFGSGPADVKGVGNPHHFVAGGQRALPVDANGAPWTGDYVFASGDLVEDLTHNFFVETAARNNKLKVYEMVDHPAPRIPTDKIPECRPHIERGDHLRLYRFSPDDDGQLAAVFNGLHPATGEELEVVDGPPEGAEPNDLPPQPAVFAPDYAPEEISAIADRLKQAAGIS